VTVGGFGVLIGVLVAARSGDQWPAELEVVGVALTGDEREFRCPADEVRVVAVVTTNGGEGMIDAEWVAVDTEPASVEVPEGTTSTRFEFVVPLAGDQPFDGSVSFRVVDPHARSGGSFEFEYRCG